MSYALSVWGFVSFCFLPVLESSQPTSLKIIFPWQSVNSLLMMKILLDTYWSFSVLLLYLSPFVFHLLISFCWILGIVLWYYHLFSLGRYYSIWIFLMAICFCFYISIFHSSYSCFDFAYIYFYNFLFSYILSFITVFTLNICSLN